MKKKKVWIFGDSYADMVWDDVENNWPTRWPVRISQKYEVTNFAACGSGLESSINTLSIQVNRYQKQKIDLSDITIIFYVSEYLGRPNFQFVKNPGDQANLKYIANSEHIVYTMLKQFWSPPNKHMMDLKKKYNEYLNFIKDYFLYIYKHDDSNPLFFSQILLLKYFSSFFNKLLCVPIFYSPHMFYGGIENTDKFIIAEGLPLNSITATPGIPNHMTKENHDIVYDMTVDWIENNAVFDTNKLVKNN